MASDAAPSTAQSILDTAEALVRGSGYHAASFRVIAQRIGIKSASIHYHFPTKEDLGVALMRRYLERSLEALGKPEDAVGPEALLERYLTVYRHAVYTEGKPCLAAMINMEAAGLPESVRRAACGFVHTHIDWLARVFGQVGGVSPELARARAWLCLSALQGAVSASLAGAGAEAFEAVAGQLRRLLEPA